MFDFCANFGRQVHTEQALTLNGPPLQVGSGIGSLRLVGS